MVSLRTAARRFAAGLTLTLAAAFLAAGAAQGQQLTDGKEYTRLKVAQAVDTGKKIEVLEFFSYGCPHCAHLDPELAKWQKTLPADVEFKRVPVMFQDRWVALAKVYYTLEAMGEERRLTPEVFIALHEKGSNLWQDKVFFDWAAQHGLDRKKVEDVYTSFAVSSKINRAKQLSQAYNVQSVPMVVVDGKFVTASDRVGTHANLPPVIDQLVAKARAERPKS
jgi:thiol:disulfide interchange protein DsbA